MVRKKLVIESEDEHELEKALRHDDMCFAITEIIKLIEEEVKFSAESPEHKVANRIYFKTHEILEKLELSSIIYHSQKALIESS